MIASFLGGIALFLLGMKMLTDGLKLSAGDSLRNLLARWTSSKTKGVLSGMLITGIVQSSSAVIFATIGFVNAGIMSLAQAVYVIFGSNVGTTFTGWIISLVGLKIDMQLIAMPILAVGVVLWLSREGSKSGGWGQALVGLSLFFLGVDVLKDTFMYLGEDIPFTSIGNTWASRLLMVGIGIGLTTLMQSSSATIAVVLTAAAGGFIPLPAAAIMVIGADIGTTSTALFAVIGSTANAKRSATVHVLFNVVNGLIAFLFVDVYLAAISFLTGDGFQVATSIALFHTLKKLTGLLILLPFSAALVSRLEKMYVKSERPETKPRYLDDTLLDTPSLAISALIFEIKRVGTKSRDTVRHVIANDLSHQEIHRRAKQVDELHLAVIEFIQKMTRLRMPENLEYSLPQALRVLQYFKEASDHALEVEHMMSTIALPEAVKVDIHQLSQELYHLSNACESEWMGFDIEQVNQLETHLEHTYNEVKMSILSAGSQMKYDVQTMLNLHELIRNYKRMADQLSKAARFMDDFNKLLEHEPRNNH